LPAKIISGKEIAAEIRADLKPEVEQLKADKGVTPGLAVVLVGEDPASQVYVRMKGKACGEMGMHSETITLPDTTSEDELLATVDRLNEDPKIHGMIVQLPVPDHINSTKVLERIDPRKDVDGFHPRLGVSSGDALRRAADVDSCRRRYSGSACGHRGALQHRR
jgi:methylenetetrahydrofolate dehydrogenase (NADP+)/methenyltetrahydrofolate cyclohydrolase